MKKNVITRGVLLTVALTIALQPASVAAGSNTPPQQTNWITSLFANIANYFAPTPPIKTPVNKKAPTRVVKPAPQRGYTGITGIAYKGYTMVKNHPWCAITATGVLAMIGLGWFANKMLRDFQSPEEQTGKYVVLKKNDENDDDDKNEKKKNDKNKQKNIIKTEEEDEEFEDDKTPGNTTLLNLVPKTNIKNQNSSQLQNKDEKITSSELEKEWIVVDKDDPVKKMAITDFTDKCFNKVKEKQEMTSLIKQEFIDINEDDIVKGMAEMSVKNSTNNVTKQCFDKVKEKQQNKDKEEDEIFVKKMLGLTQFENVNKKNETIKNYVQQLSSAETRKAKEQIKIQLEKIYTKQLFDIYNKQREQQPKQNHNQPEKTEKQEQKNKIEQNLQTMLAPENQKLLVQNNLERKTLDVRLAKTLSDTLYKQAIYQNAASLSKSLGLKTETNNIDLTQTVVRKNVFDKKDVDLIKKDKKIKTHNKSLPPLPVKKEPSQEAKEKQKKLQNALIGAIENNNTVFIPELINAGAKLNQPDETSRLPIEYAQAPGMTFCLIHYGAKLPDQKAEEPMIFDFIRNFNQDKENFVKTYLDEDMYSAYWPNVLDLLVWQKDSKNVQDFYTAINNVNSKIAQKLGLTDGVEYLYFDLSERASELNEMKQYNYWKTQYTPYIDTNSSFKEFLEVDKATAEFANELDQSQFEKVRKQTLANSYIEIEKEIEKLEKNTEEPDVQQTICQKMDNFIVTGNLLQQVETKVTNNLNASILQNSVVDLKNSFIPNPPQLSEPKKLVVPTIIPTKGISTTDMFTNLHEKLRKKVEAVKNIQIKSVYGKIKLDEKPKTTNKMTNNLIDSTIPNAPDIGDLARSKLMEKKQPTGANNTSHDDMNKKPNPIGINIDLKNIKLKPIKNNTQQIEDKQNKFNEILTLIQKKENELEESLSDSLEESTSNSLIDSFAITEDMKKQDKLNNKPSQETIIAKEEDTEEKKPAEKPPVAKPNKVKQLLNKFENIAKDLAKSIKKPIIEEEIKKNSYVLTDSILNKSEKKDKDTVDHKNIQIDKNASINTTRDLYLKRIRRCMESTINTDSNLLDSSILDSSISQKSNIKNDDNDVDGDIKIDLNGSLFSSINKAEEQLKINK